MSFKLSRSDGLGSGTISPFYKSGEQLWPPPPDSHSASSSNAIPDLELFLHDTADQMRVGSRTFRIRGPFGVEVVVGTKVPGKLSISFGSDSETSGTPSSSSGDSARKSLPPMRTYSFDISMGEAAKTSLASSSSSSSSAPKGSTSTATPEASTLASSADITTATPSNLSQQTFSSASSPRTALSRQPSLAETEILEENVTQEDRNLALGKMGINVHDFAYPAFPSAYAGPSASRITPETFDAYKGLGEFELRVRQASRKYPITGKTLHRLMKIGFITQSEAETRCAPIDFVELERYRAMCIARSPTGRLEDGEYPWRPLIDPQHNGTGILPTIEDRDYYRLLALNLFQVDKLRDKAAAQAAWDARQAEWERRELLKMQRARTAAAVAAVAEHTALRGEGEGEGEGEVAAMDVATQPSENSLGKKRASPDDDEPDAAAPGDGDTSSRPSPGKRTRLSPPAPVSHGSDTRSTAAPAGSVPSTGSSGPPKSRASSQQSQPSRLRDLTPPSKQYPAPLASYDPAMYPDAAMHRQAYCPGGAAQQSLPSSQSQSQPVDRVSTPPADEAPPPPPPSRRRLKRTLSRTATLANF